MSAGFLKAPSRRSLLPPPRAITAIDAFIRQPLVLLAAAAVCSLVIVVAATPRALPMAGGLLATILIGTAAPWLAVIGLRGRGRFDRQRCRVGESIQAEVSLEGHTAGWVDESSIEWSAARVAASRRDGRLLQVTLLPERRGRFPSSPPRVATNRPFGLVTAGRRIPFEGAVIVRPPTTPICFPAALVAPRRHGHEPSEGVLGGCGDILGSRDYRPGDSTRQIHWPQTARRDRLVVCEWPANGSPTMRLVLAVHDPRLPPAEASAVLDAAVVIASSVVEAWAQRGVCCDLVSHEGSSRVRDPRSLEQALDTLACLELPAVRGSPAPAAAGQPSSRCGYDLELLIAPAGVVEQQRRCSAPDLQPGTARLTIGLASGDADAGARTIRPANAADRLILLPATADATHLLDACLSEIGHDPDTKRR